MIAATFDDVPPTSTMTASPTRSVRSAPATDAAGPEYSVRAGAFWKPARSVAPPSPRMTITGLWMPAAATPASTTRAVSVATGRIEAFNDAVTVRSSRP